MATNLVMEEPSPGGRQDFDREQQLLIVGVSHMAILIVVGLIISGCGISVTGVGTFSVWPGWFFAGEIAIIVACVVLSSRVPKFRTLANWWQPLVQPLLDLWEWLSGRGWVDRRALRWLRARGSRLEAMQGRALLAATVLQFAALVPLLEGTGGPTGSPFAPMALAYAIFTPFIAREDRTMLAALIMSVLYYGLVVWLMEVPPPDLGDDGKWAFFWVNALFATIGVVLTYLERANDGRNHDGSDDEAGLGV